MHPSPTPERAAQVWQLFDEAVDLDPEEHTAFLDQACADDPDLRRQVEALLRADQHADDAFRDLDRPLVEEADRLIGRTIAHYTIVREIGHGGMGAVYLAERADGQFQQQVALKLLRPGLHRDDLHRRFLAERQILARLQHPNIARFIDGGVTEAASGEPGGHPYFLMEYVEGTLITAYCDQHTLTINERLALFLDVCVAVQYAHRNLVVHRDLKPSNILVTEDPGSSPGQARVKLLDFGIAKLLEDDPASGTVFRTETGLRMMTPEYASPEQVRGEPVTTASDVYQLGVLLYELLTGHRPYRLPSRLLHEVARIICEEIPERPSTAVTSTATVGDQDGVQPIRPEQVSAARGTSVDRLRRRLNGDLDTIVLMALRKEPERRYASVEQLGEDVRRHLAGLPVVARKDTVGYRASKFVQRHRVGVVAAGVLVLSLLGGLTGTMWQAQIAREERDRAQGEAAKAVQVAEFMQDLFEVSNRAELQGEAVKARELLEAGVDRIRKEWSDQPEAQAVMLDVTGRVYQDLGLYAEATPLLEEALLLRRQQFGGAHPEVAQSLNNVGILRLDQAEHPAAESLHREALAMRRTLYGAEHPDVAQSLYYLATALYRQEEYPAAESLHREALAMNRKLLGEEHPAVARTLNELALLFQVTGKYAAAESLYREVLAMNRKLLGEEYSEAGFNRREIQIEIGFNLNNLGYLLMRWGDYAEAELVLREALALKRKLYGPEHPSTANTMHGLALVLSGQRAYAAAESLFHQVLAVRRKVFGDDFQSVGVTLVDLGRLHQDRGDYATAASLYREGRDITRAHRDDDYPLVAHATGYLASALHAQGKTDTAERLYEEALDKMRTAWPKGHFLMTKSLLEFGALWSERGEAGRAEPLLREVLSIQQQALPVGNWQTAETMSALGACLTALARYGEAESLLVEGYTLLNDQRGAQDPKTQAALASLVALYKAWDKPDQARTYQALHADRKPPG